MKHLRLESGAFWETSEKEHSAITILSEELCPGVWVTFRTPLSSRIYPLDCLSLLLLHLPYVREDGHLSSLGQPWAP